ncbi:PAS domain S-box protein [Paenibacillus sepulcri]|uniref:histidine kinase n=1 Tax=Paenibacillus sepulcri TaxID=359917 RepID=A0ABS7C708_9BACL|nr:PAS domain S-box protein [Paenibacillus sepulcri]
MGILLMFENADGENVLETFLEEILPYMIVVKNGKIITINSDASRLFGYDRNKLIGMELLELIHPRDRRTYLIEEEEVKGNKNKNIVWQARGIRQDHSIFPLEIHGMMKLFHGIHLFLITEVADLTERQQIEKADKQIEERFRTVFNYAAAGIALIDINGRFLEANYSFCDILGYTESELAELRFHGILHPDHLDDHLDNTTRLLIAEIPWYEMESRFIHKSGHVVWGLLNTTVVRDDHNKPLYYIVQFQDITTKKEAEELIRKSDKLMAVGQLAAGVAHEVRNPLTVLKGFTQMLRTTDKKNESYYQLMLSEVDRIESIIGEFLMLAKPQEVEFKMNDIGVILSNIIILMETNAVISNVQIISNLGNEQMYLECDENQIKQALANILQNAIEAMPQGGQIIVTVEQLDADHLIIGISDQGCGISEDRIARLGEPFYSSKEKGTGLGLMISYQIIEKHNGRVRVNSKLNEGTTFEIILPLHQDAEPPALPDQTGL